MSDHSSVPLYDGWRAERWATPVSDAGSLRLVSLLDDGTLQVIVEDAHHPERLRWRFTFRNVPAYLNLLEEYRLELWAMAERQGARLGWTVRIPESPWLAASRRRSPCLRSITRTSCTIKWRPRTTCSTFSRPSLR